MRSVVTERDVETFKNNNPDKKAEIAELEKKKDDYISQLAKFIPAEVVSFYTGISVSAQAVMTEIPYESISWVMFILGLIATIFFSLTIAMKELTSESNDVSGRKIKPAITTIAFIVWAFTLGPPFNSIDGYHPFYGTLAMTFYTLMTPKIYELAQIIGDMRKKDQTPVPNPND